MTCKDIFDLYASDTEKSDLCDAYRNVPLDSRDEIHKNNTPLHTACYFADITAVAILLERGADTNVRNGDGDTPLCVMAKRNSCPNDTLYADISGLLLSKGAKVTRSGINTTALIEAVRNRHFLMADVLLMTGNRIDSTDWNGDNVLHAICDSAGYIANNIKSRKKRIADFAERWYSDKDKQETYEELESLLVLDKQCCYTAWIILESGQIDSEEKNNCGKAPFLIAAPGNSEPCYQDKNPKQTRLRPLPGD